MYSKKDCQQCRATERKLKELDLDYQYVDIQSDDEAMERIKELGYLQAPVVVVGDSHWSGYRPDKIGELR